MDVSIEESARLPGREHRPSLYCRVCERKHRTQRQMETCASVEGCPFEDPVRGPRRHGACFKECTLACAHCALGISVAQPVQSGCGDPDRFSSARAGRSFCQMCFVPSNQVRPLIFHVRAVHICMSGHIRKWCHATLGVAAHQKSPSPRMARHLARLAAFLPPTYRWRDQHCMHLEHTPSHLACHLAVVCRMA